MSKTRNADSKLVKVTNLDDIEFNNYRNIDPKRVDALVGSILKVNVLEPVHLLRVKESGKKFKLYIIAGHHRYVAVKKIRENYPHLGDLALPALIQEGTKEELHSKNVTTQSVVTNEAREESNIIDRAKGYALLRKNGMSVREICDVVGRSRRMVERTLQVDLLPDEIKEFVVENLDRVRESTVFGVAARFKRGENVSAEDFENKPLSKSTSTRNKIQVSLVELEKILLKRGLSEEGLRLVIAELT